MENDLLRWFRETLPAHPRILLGPGDDAAILRLADEANLVATTDMLMDGVDFLLAEHEPERIGRKALAVNLSDLAAMAAQPVAALVSLALPQRGGVALAQRLYAGLTTLAAKHDCPIAGGDTNSWEGPLVISITALGEVPPERRWRRSGAQPGDALLVTGSLGGSILSRQFDFEPRVREALWLADHAMVHAAIDISDGLALDLWRLLEASGCGAIVEESSVPIASAAEELARRDGRPPLDHALCDGEDFELLLAVPPDEAERLLADQPLGVPLIRIGLCTDEGLWLRAPEGELSPLAPHGFQHRLDP
ncbi:MAG: thiamine-phosphate kinase [Pirellulaceae bacterium]|nr:thiamine-phosphate kinase [Pirellulaceae bacterium]